MVQHLYKLFTITGPSGAGKSTLANAAFDHQQQITSFTSRPKRPGEVEGIDYYFISKADALKLHQEDACIEFVEYNSNYYGITKEELLTKLSHADSAVVVNKAGYEHLCTLPELAKAKIEPIFLQVTKAQVKAHFKTRQDSPTAIANRLSLYESEAKNLSYFKDKQALIFKVGDSKAENEQRFRDLIKKHATPRRIAIEGGEGSGKSTLIEMLKDVLPANQFTYVVEPGTTPLGKLMRQEVVYDPSLTLKQQTYLFAISRWSINHEVVMPALEAGKQVIFDRSLFSNLVYQSGSGLSIDDILAINQQIDPVFTPPDLIIYLDIDPAVAYQRIKRNKRETNYFDEKPIKEQRAWRHKAFKLLPRYRHLVISSQKLARDPKAVIKQIVDIL